MVYLECWLFVILLGNVEFGGMCYRHTVHTVCLYKKLTKYTQLLKKIQVYVPLFTACGLRLAVWTNRVKSVLGGLVVRYLVVGIRKHVLSYTNCILYILYVYVLLFTACGSRLVVRYRPPQIKNIFLVFSADYRNVAWRLWLKAAADSKADVINRKTKYYETIIYFTV